MCTSQLNNDYNWILSRCHPDIRSAKQGCQHYTGLQYDQVYEQSEDELLMMKQTASATTSATVKGNPQNPISTLTCSFRYKQGAQLRIDRNTWWQLGFKMLELFLFLFMT